MSQHTPDEAGVQAVLAECNDPETGRSLVKNGQVNNIRVSEDGVSFTLALSTHSLPIRDEVVEALQERLRVAFPQHQNIQVETTVLDRPPARLGQIGLTCKSVIAVGSGKGGVGKSTVAACLALTLKQFGSRVGLLDADVYGPSVPHLLGLPPERPAVVENRIVPVDSDGMPVMSMGFLLPPGEAVVWRGPMLHGAITQFLRDTNWGPLDYLLIDMPPGTGDVALSLSQALPLTGAVVVCTPQDVALLDAVKAIAMFRKVNIPVLGMVENMSGFVCPECHTRHDIFGSGGARQRAEELEMRFLGEIPLNIQIRTEGDAGTTNNVVEDPVLGPAFQSVCRHIVRNLKPQAPSLPVLG